MLHSHVLWKQSSFDIFFLAIRAFHRCLQTNCNVVLQHVKRELAFAFERALDTDALVEMLQKRRPSIVAYLLAVVALRANTFFAYDDRAAFVLQRL